MNRLRVLVLSGQAPLLDEVKRALGSSADFHLMTAQTADAGLKAVVSGAPNLVFVDLDLPQNGGVWLLRRIRDDYVGRPPKTVLLVDPRRIDSSIANLSAHAVILKPVTAAVIAEAAASFRDSDESAYGDLQRSLVRMSLLSADLEGSARNLTLRIARSLRVTRCLLNARVGDSRLASVSDGNYPRDDDPMWLLLQFALETKLPILNSSGPQGHTAVAIPVESMQGERLGFITIDDNRARLFPISILDRFRDFGRRLYEELSWLSVHQSIAADRDKLRERDAFDPTLKIWTRTALEKHLPREVSAAQERREPICFAVLDVCGLRDVNRRLGHAAGDALLRHMARILKSEMAGNELVARYRGDRFAVVLPATTVAAGVERLENLQESLAAPLNQSGAVITGRVVAGLSTLIGQADSGVEALTRAAIAIEYAKEREQGVAVFDASMRMRPTRAFTGLEGGMTLGGMYKILHEISRGAMGVVYRAQDLGLGRGVALKTLRPEMARDEELVDLFKREAATLAKLRHDNLVQVHSFGVDQNQVFFAMELVEGESLDDRIVEVSSRGEYIPLEKLCTLLPQIASALDALHDAGIMHRDVKPANILLDRRLDRAVLVDFGIATGDASELPAGTPGFAAPEIFRGERPTPAADVYGLAATMYSALVNEFPYELDSRKVMAVVGRQLAAPPRPPTRYRSSLSDAVDKVLLRALHSNPKERYRRASRFAAELVAALAETSVVHKPRISPSASVTGKRKAFSKKGRGTVGGLSTTWRHATAENDTPPPSTSEPMTRGLLFCAAHQVGFGDSGNKSDVEYNSPGADTMLGAGWLQILQARRADFAEAFGPDGNQFSWYRTQTFIDFLEAVAAQGRDAHELARALGQFAAASTFSSFAGDDVASLSLADAVARAPAVWRQYHSWGSVGVEKRGDGIEVTVLGSPASEYLCSATMGMLESIVSASHSDASITHSSCTVEGGKMCVYRVAV